MSDGAREEIERVPLNLRVSESVKNAYEDAIYHERGCVSPYAAVTLEDELQVLLDQGPVADLWATTGDLLDTLDLERDEKKIEAVGVDRGETTVVGYRIAADVRAGVKELAEQGSFESAGGIIERVMWSYATSGSRLERLRKRIGQLEDTVRSVDTDESLGPKQRRQQQIADALGCEGAFTLDQFDDAVDAHAEGISAGKHERKRHLGPVLELLDYTWHPNNPSLFYPREYAKEQGWLERQDPRRKPKFLRDKRDEREAIILDAIEKSRDSRSQLFKYEPSDAQSLINRQHSTLRSHFQKIANEWDGFGMQDDTLIVDSREIPNPNTIVP